MLRSGTVQIEHNGFNGFRQFTTHIGCRILRHQSPAADVVDMLHALLVVAILHGGCSEITHAPVFLTTLHQIVGQQEQIGVYHCRHVDLRVTFRHRGCQFRLGHHATLISLHIDNARQFALGTGTDVQLIEDIVQDILLAIKEVTDVQHDRRRVGRHGLYLQCSQNGVDIVVGH